MESYSASNPEGKPINNCQGGYVTVRQVLNKFLMSFSGNVNDIGR